jgi:hypothetical protein
MDASAPLLLTSPSVRSGTTLLQRLLCSSANALVYGEEVGKDLALQLQVLSSRRLVYAHSRQRFAHSLSRVLAGDTDDWLIDLMPDLDAYLGALDAGAFAGLDSCRQHAQAAGRSVWGFKYPGWPPPLMRLLHAGQPGTRVLYLRRNLADTARSAKAWDGLAEADVEPFCQQWLEHLRFMHAWRQQAPVLMLDFDTLVQRPEQAIAELGAFIPVSGMDPAVLTRRINNAVQGQDSRRATGHYIAPAPLTAREQAWVDAAQAAADALA